MRRQQRLQFSCWNGEVIRLAFIIDAFDREIIAWTAVANAGISGWDVRDMMLEPSRSGKAGVWDHVLSEIPRLSMVISS